MADFEVLDARIASALNRIIHNSYFERRVSLEEQKAQKEDRFLRGRQIAFLIYMYFSLEPMILSRIMPTFLLLHLEMTIFRNSYRARFTKQEFWREKWKLWEKRRGQESRDNSVYKEFLETGNGKPTSSVLKEIIAVSRYSEACKIATAESFSFMRQNERNASRTRSPEARSPSGRMSRWPCKDYLKGTCTDPFCEKWHLPECLFHKTKSGCRFGEKCSYAQRQVDEQPSKRSKKNDDRSAVAMLKKHELHDRTGQPVVCRDNRHVQGHGPVVCNSSNTWQLGCVFQDMVPPKLSSILRKSSDKQKPIQRVKFTNAIARYAKIRDQNLELGMICLGEPHQRSPNAPKFEDRSQEETEWQERWALEAALRLANSILTLKEKIQATFFSPSENRCLPASTLKPEEREFVVDSGASMRMISKKDLSDAEMDTLTKSCCSTIVITANGEVQTHEEATVYVTELDIFLKMKVLENTPAVLSLGKLCDENGYSYEWINGQKPHLI